MAAQVGHPSQKQINRRKAMALTSIKSRSQKSIAGNPWQSLQIAKRR